MLDLSSIAKIALFIVKIAGRFIEAKSDNGPGGRAVTPAELIGVYADVSWGWCAVRSQPAEIKESELVHIFEQNGWAVLRDLEHTHPSHAVEQDV